MANTPCCMLRLAIHLLTMLITSAFCMLLLLLMV